MFDKSSSNIPFYYFLFNDCSNPIPLKLLSFDKWYSLLDDCSNDIPFCYPPLYKSSSNIPKKYSSFAKWRSIITCEKFIFENGSNEISDGGSNCGSK